MKFSFYFFFLSLAITSLTFTSCSSDDDPAEMEEMEEMADPIIGEWSLASTEAALAVGPAPGSADWWFNTTDDVAARACLFDDVWTFGADGSFSINQGSQTWLEAWQGSDPESCGAPVAPHNGSGSFTFTKEEDKITLQGAGAYIGLPKAFNGGELSDGVSTEPSSRTYTILESSSNSMKLGIPIAGEGNWTFILAKK